MPNWPSIHQRSICVTRKRDNIDMFIIETIKKLNDHGYLNWMPDKMNIHLMYRLYMGKWLHLTNPKTFNEKMQWIKLYDRNPKYTKLVDKYAVREHIANTIGSSYLIPILGVWDHAEDIPFDTLPNQFVLKCNHDSGSVIVCKNKQKLDRESAIRFLSERLQFSGCMHGREWPYKDIERKVIAEQYMEDADTHELRDYKFHCFKGEPQFILVCTGRKSKQGLREDFFDTEWNHLPVQRPAHGNASVAIPKPEQFDEMYALSRQLAEDMPFSRIDFYVVNGKVYFGEITMFPTSGYTAFVPDTYDELFGSWIELPQHKTK